MTYLLYIIIFVLLLYIASLLYIIYGFIQLKKKSVNNSNDAEQKISIIIAARNESENIAKCIKSLIHQNYDKNNFEIIVVDDHSTDDTILIVEEIIKDTTHFITLHQLTDRLSKKEALKQGIKYAKYSIIATTDADCVLPENWLKIIGNNLKYPTSMLLGPVTFLDEKDFLGAFQFLDMCAMQGVTFGLAYHQQPVLNNGANLSYLREVYHKVGGYDNYETPSGDDIFLLEKFKSQQQQILGVLNKEFIVKTDSKKSWNEFFHQRMRWASKASHYKDKLMLLFSMLVFFQNLIILFIYGEMLFVEEMRFTDIILIMSKWSIDFILLFLLSSFFDKRKRLLYFIPVQIFYPIYIVLIGLVSKFYKFKWKDRIFNE
ncbi:MAG: glycosyltransferase [Vicingus serpentipes]|nr:glycosyltransferase [Vicingus serpentipes]